MKLLMVLAKAYRPLFSFIPLGTVNDLARALGIPLDPELAIEALKMPNTSDRYCKIEEKYFMNIVAIGEVASRVADTSVERKTKFGSLAYLIEGAKAYHISHEENEMTITHIRELERYSDACTWWL